MSPFVLKKKDKNKSPNHNKARGIRCPYPRNTNPPDFEFEIMKKIKCELCDSRANTYCESDQASLCWSCDANVHSANFIVEKHSRTLLCHICQSPTPWTATGRNLGPTVSVCRLCVNAQNHDDDNHHRDSGDGFDQSSPTIRDPDDDGHDHGDDEANQVVPLSPPPVSSSSRSEGS